MVLADCDLTILNYVGSFFVIVLPILWLRIVSFRDSWKVGQFACWKRTEPPNFLTALSLQFYLVTMRLDHPDQMCKENMPFQDPGSGRAFLADIAASKLAGKIMNSENPVPKRSFG